jgi:hypothetical protein
LDAGIEESKLEAGYHLSSRSQVNQRIETPEPNLSDGNGAMSPEEVTMIELTAKPILSDKTPVGTVGPDTQELQNIKNMILSLQLDLQEERSKREILEEKLRKLEGNSARPSMEMRASEWELSDNLGLNLDVSQNQPLVPPRNTTKGVDEKIGDLSLEFHRKFRNLSKSLSEMRSVLANNLGCGLKGGKKIQAGPSEVKDYNRFVYKKLQRGIFPRQISLKNALVKSLDE